MPGPALLHFAAHFFFRADLDHSFTHIYDMFIKHLLQARSGLSLVDTSHFGIMDKLSMALAHVRHEFY